MISKNTVINNSLQDFFKLHNIDPKNSSVPYFTEKVKKNPNRLIKENEIFSHFLKDLDQCKYFDLDTISSLNIFKIIPSLDKNKKIILFFAFRFPQDKKSLEKIHLCFIDALSKQLDKPYLFFYFNHKSNKTPLAFLKNCYKRLPLQYIFNLERLLIINAGITTKSTFLLESNFHSKLLKTKIKYVKDINKLSKLEGFHQEYLEYFPEELFKKAEESLMISHILPKANEIINVDITDLSLSESGIPEILALLVSYFEMDSKFVKTEGIFRKTASENDIKRLEKALVERDLDYVFEVTNPHVVASLLKRIFNKTLSPIVLFEHYDQMVNIGHINEKNTEDYIGKLTEQIKLLPKLNQRILSFMIAFIRKIIKKKEDNLMNSFNMAMVFAPCFIRPKVYSQEDIAKTPYIISSLKYMIENYQAIFEEKFEDSDGESFIGIEEFDANQMDSRFLNPGGISHVNLNLKTDENKKLNEGKKISLQFPNYYKSDYEGKKNLDKKRNITVDNNKLIKKISKNAPEEEKNEFDEFQI